MKQWFSSDWHLGEDRIGINGKPNLFYRPFNDIFQQDFTIQRNFIESGFRDGDTFNHLGDVIVNLQSEYILTQIRNLYPKSKFVLIRGNYDEGKEELLSKYFDDIYEYGGVIISGKHYLLNHYPVNCVSMEFSLVGHIHGAWKT